MTVQQIVDGLRLRVVAGASRLNQEVSGGYVGDLLSCVMARARAGNIWVTVQAHQNVIAVASLAGVSAVIVSEGSAIDAATAMRANQEGIPLLSTQSASFEVVAALVEMGVESTDAQALRG
jgi:predicted transcriptional regulator